MQGGIELNLRCEQGTKLEEYELISIASKPRRTKVVRMVLYKSGKGRRSEKVLV